MDDGPSRSGAGRSPTNGLVPTDALVAALDALAAELPAELPGQVALDRARILLAEAERLKTLALVALGDVDTRELHTLEGAPTTGSWIEDQQVPGLDRREVTLARRLPSTPHLTADLLAGRISARAAAQVGTALSKARPFLDRPDGRIDEQPGEPALRAVAVDGVADLLAEQTGGGPPDDPGQQRLRAELTGLLDRPTSQRDRLEAALLVFARRSATSHLRSGLDLLLDALLPAEHDRRAARADTAAELDLQLDPLGSGWLLRGRLDDITGELLATVLAAEESVDSENATDTTAWRLAGDDPDLADLPPHQWPTQQPAPRSRASRSHAALGSALRRLLDTGALGSRDKALPHLVVSVSSEQLDGAPGALPARGAHGSRLARRHLRAVGCRSLFTRLVLDATRRVIAASHTQRTATALERLIVHTQWGGSCARAGCARGPATGDRLIPHHADLFSRTGRTALADTVPLCEADHHHLHDERRALRLQDGRWIGPDGWLQRESA